MKADQKYLGMQQLIKYIIHERLSKEIIHGNASNKQKKKLEEQKSQ